MWVAKSTYSEALNCTETNVGSFWVLKKSKEKFHSIKIHTQPSTVVGSASITVNLLLNIGTCQRCLTCLVDKLLNSKAIPCQMKKV